MPIIKNLVQNTPKWHDFRAAHIMATDIPCILGSNPWVTKLQRWEEKLKLRPPQEMNDAMRRGILLEDEARALASKLIGINFTPCVYQSNEFPWLAASLDGISKCGQYILEIKCPSEYTHVDATDGIIPIYYQDQIQTQILVSVPEVCYYFSYRPEYKSCPYAIEAVHPDREKQSLIIEKGFEFYLQMCNFEMPVEWVFERNR